MLLTVSKLGFFVFCFFTSHSHCQWPVTVLYFTWTKSRPWKSSFDFALLSEYIEHKTLKVSFLQLLCSPFEPVKLKVFLRRRRSGPCRLAVNYSSQISKERMEPSRLFDEHSIMLPRCSDWQVPSSTASLEFQRSFAMWCGHTAWGG